MLPSLQNSKALIARFDTAILRAFVALKTFGRQEESYEIMNRVYYEHLHNFQAELVIQAFEHWIENYDEFPTIRMIREYVWRHPKYDTSHLSQEEKTARIRELAGIE